MPVPGHRRRAGPGGRAADCDRDSRGHGWPDSDLGPGPVRSAARAAARAAAEAGGRRGSA